MTARELVELYREPVPTIDEFLTSPHFLGEQVRECDLHFDTLREIFDPSRRVNLGAIVWGIGAGKSFLVSVAFSYIVYRLLCLRDPQRYYGLSPGSLITLANFSISATQANSVVFREIASRVDNAPAFQRPGFQRDRKVMSCLRWPDASIEIFPGTSQSRSGLGYNILAAAVDECSWFPRIAGKKSEAGETKQGESDDAEELIETLRERMKSRGGNSRWRRDNLMLAISSPRSKADWLYKILQSPGSDGTTVISHAASWQGFPSLSLSGETFVDDECGPVPIEYATSFESNPQRARRNYGAIFLDRYNPFFSAGELIDLAFSLEDNIFDDLSSLRRWEPCCGATRYVHVDLGVRRDRCGIACCHHHGPTLVVDGACALDPADFENDLPLSLPRAIIETLAGIVPVKASYDGFQSMGSIQELNAQGIPTILLSVDRGTEAYDTLKERIHSGGLLGPQFDVLREELLSLEWDAAKGKVDHPREGSKDVADAVAGSVCHASRDVAAAIDEPVRVTVYDAIPNMRPVRLGLAR